jgi:AmmeMemoRadiSam system protein A
MKGCVMMESLLSKEERKYLLRIARKAIENAVNGKPIEVIDLKIIPEGLKEIGASFVTLTKKGELRGCIGALEPSKPLVLDVQEHAIAAALSDYRFPPVSSSELDDLEIEISRLTIPKKLEYKSVEELLSKIRPGIDGVILKDGFRRATFLPQVWKKIANKEIFLSQLCLKMGSDPDFWRRKNLEVATYQVEEFHE